jgi:hypothetical protein
MVGGSQNRACHCEVEESAASVVQRPLRHSIAVVTAAAACS